jgi:hypothetical protein
MSRIFSENLIDLHLTQIGSDGAKAANQRVCTQAANRLQRRPLRRRRCILATEYSPFHVNASRETAP